jgi:hypothetical protein
MAVKPIQRFKKWRRRKARLKDLIGEEKTVKKWHQSLTIRGLAASGVAFAIGTVFGVPDPDVASLTDRVVAWGIEGVQLGGLLVAAYGRKRASAPLG